MRKAKVITALALTVVMLTAMTGIAAANGDDEIRFWGTIKDANGAPYDCTVKIMKGTEPIGECPTDGGGNYAIPQPNSKGDNSFYLIGEKAGDYTLYINGQSVQIRTISDGDWQETPSNYGCWETRWTYEWNYQIPEFATIAIPVASILGLLFFFNHRKHKKE